MVALGREPEIQVVEAVARLEEALELCRTDPPDVILLDLRLPDTPPERAVAQIRAAHPAGSILLLSTDEAGDDLCRALEAGAAGGVPRTAEPEELMEALRTIHNGASWLPPGIAERGLAYRAGARLDDDELACLRLRAAGNNRQQIAAALGWSEARVQQGMRRMQKKLDAKNETHMLVIAMQRGIVPLE